MKYFIKIVSIIGLLAVSHFAYAGSINHIFVDGDTLEASHLNEATTAINDNDARISVLEVVYAIGDTGPAGGWVFYVDVNGQHGLEAALTDQSPGIRWDNGGASTNTEARGDGVGAGEMNTMLIIANQGSDSSTYAAGLCANLVITNAGVDYGDWYLPSKFELNLMYLNIGKEVRCRSMWAFLTMPTIGVPRRLMPPTPISSNFWVAGRARAPRAATPVYELFGLFNLWPYN
jgi:hypothetical protein